MDRDKFLEAVRRATEVEMLAAVEFAALRALGDELSQRRGMSRNLTAEIAQHRASPSVRGSRNERAEIAQQIAQAEAAQAELAAQIEVIQVQVDRHQEAVNIYAPQRDNALRLLAKLRTESKIIAGVSHDAEA